MLFLESPWPILTLGLVVETCLAVALFRTGRGNVLWAMGGVALVVLLGVLLERYTITDTKRVRQTLNEAAAGLLAHNAARVKACIVPGPDGAQARNETDHVLGLGEFLELNISNLDLKFNYQTSPPTVEATFMAFVRGRSHGELAGEFAQPVKVEVKLRKESGRWLFYGEPKYNPRD